VIVIELEDVLVIEGVGVDVSVEVGVSVLIDDGDK